MAAKGAVPTLDIIKSFTPNLLHVCSAEVNNYLVRKSTPLEDILVLPYIPTNFYIPLVKKRP